MISTILSPQDVVNRITEQVQARRLSLNFSQKTLSERSGVSLGVLKKFERSGKIIYRRTIKTHQGDECRVNPDGKFLQTIGLRL